MNIHPLRRSGPRLGALLLCGALGGPAGAAGLSVREVVAEALRSNPEVEEAAWTVEEARARLGQARAAFRPVVGVDVGVTAADAPSVALVKTVDSRTLAPGANFNRPGELEALDAGLGVRHTLLDGGRRRLAEDLAALGVDARTHGRDAVLNALIQTTVHAYYDVLAAAEAVEAARESLRTVAAELEEMRVRARGGGALRADVLSLEVRRAEARQREIAAENAVELATAALARVLDRAIVDAPQLSGEDWEPAGLPEGFAAGWAVAQRLRPELAAREVRVRAAEKGLEAGWASERPRVDMQGRYWMTDTDFELDRDRENWMVGVVLSWDVFDGGRRRRSREEARAAVRRAEAAERAARRGVELEVRRAYLALEEARARAEVATANVARAQEGLDLVRSQLEGGAVTITRYLQAEEDRTRARLQEIRSRYDVKKAKATVGHALGLCVANAPREEEP